MYYVPSGEQYLRHGSGSGDMCVTSGSNQLESASKYLAHWSDSSAMRPVPHAVRREGSDPREDSKVKGPTARFMVTRSYDHEYSCVSCTGASKHSIFNKETITVIIGDESKPDITPVLADGSCAVILRYAELTEAITMEWQNCFLKYRTKG